MKKVFLMAALPAALAAQRPADAGLRPITLQEAISLAQQNQPSAVQARNAIAASKLQVRSGFAAFIPTMTFSMGQNQSAGPRPGPDGTIIPFVAQPWNYTNGYSANLNLFNGGRDLWSIRQQKANVTANEASEINTRFTIALSVKTQYYAVLQARESEAAAQATLVQAREALKVSEAQEEAGTKTRADSLQSAIAVQSAQLNILQAQNTLRTASASLTRLVGSDDPVTANPADTVDKLVVLDSAVLANLAVHGPTIDQLEASLRAAQAGQHMSKSTYLPSLSVSYSRGGSGFDKYFGVGGGKLSDNRTLSIGLSYP